MNKAAWQSVFIAWGLGVLFLLFACDLWAHDETECANAPTLRAKLRSTMEAYTKKDDELAACKVQLKQNDFDVVMSLPTTREDGTLFNSEDITGFSLAISDGCVAATIKTIESESQFSNKVCKP